MDNLSAVIRRIDPINEIVDEFMQQSIRKAERRMEQLKSLKLQKDSIEKARREYDELVALGQGSINSRPDNFIRFAAAKEPSIVTLKNFTVLTGHESFSFGFTEIDTNDQMAEAFEDYLKAVDGLIVSAEDRKLFSQEIDLMMRFIGGSRNVASSYLNSINISNSIKAIYPAASCESKSLFRKTYSLLAALAEKVFVPIKIIMECIPFRIFVCLFALFVIIAAPFLLIGFGITQLKPAIDAFKAKDPAWPILSVGFRGTCVLPRFWNYLVNYHPELDIPVDFNDETFNPYPEVRPDYFPRLEFRKNVYKLFTAMIRYEAFIEKGAVITDNEIIIRARKFFLGKIKDTNRVAAAK